MQVNPPDIFTEIELWHKSGRFYQTYSSRKCNQPFSLIFKTELLEKSEEKSNSFLIDPAVMMIKPVLGGIEPRLLA
jgi:hypothetical protein